jgi:hypothetical protein
MVVKGLKAADNNGDIDREETVIEHSINFPGTIQMFGIKPQDLIQ